MEKQHMRTINNYNGVFAIMEALNHRAISRMKKTWEIVGEHYYSSLLSISLLKEKAYKQYRDHLRISVTPPCIPHLAVWKSDVISLENNTSEDVEGLINFKKLRKIGQILSLMQSFQSSFYCFLPSSEVQNFFISQWKAIKPETNDVYYARSLSIESKETSASVDLPWFKE